MDTDTHTHWLSSTHFKEGLTKAQTDGIDLSKVSRWPAREQTQTVSAQTPLLLGGRVGDVLRCTSIHRPGKASAVTHASLPARPWADSGGWGWAEGPHPERRGGLAPPPGEMDANMRRHRRQQHRGKQLGLVPTLGLSFPKCERDSATQCPTLTPNAWPSWAQRGQRAGKRRSRRPTQALVAQAGDRNNVRAPTHSKQAMPPRGAKERACR